MAYQTALGNWQTKGQKQKMGYLRETRKDVYEPGVEEMQKLKERIKKIEGKEEEYRKAVREKMGGDPLISGQLPRPRAQISAVLYRMVDGNIRSEDVIVGDP